MLQRHKCAERSRRSTAATVSRGEAQPSAARAYRSVGSGTSVAAATTRRRGAARSTRASRVESRDRQVPDCSHLAASATGRRCPHPAQPESVTLRLIFKAIDDCNNAIVTTLLHGCVRLIPQQQTTANQTNRALKGSTSYLLFTVTSINHSRLQMTIHFL